MWISCQQLITCTEWKGNGEKDCEYIYIYKGFLQWRGVLFEFQVPSRVFTFRSKLLCFPSSKTFLGSSMSLLHSVQPQGSNYTTQLFLRDPSRQEEEHKLLVRDSPRGMCSHRCPSSFQAWQLTQSSFWALKCDTLYGSNWTPSSL